MSVSAFTSVFSSTAGRSRFGSRRTDGEDAPTTAPVPSQAGPDARLPSRRELWEHVRSQAEAAAQLPADS